MSDLVKLLIHSLEPGVRQVSGGKAYGGQETARRIESNVPKMELEYYLPGQNLLVTDFRVAVHVRLQHDLTDQRLRETYCQSIPFRR